MISSCDSPCVGLPNVRPRLVGADCGFARRLGQDANGDATRSGVRPKGYVSRPQWSKSMPVGVAQQMMVRQQVHGEIAAKRRVAVAAVTTDSGELDRALIEMDVIGLMRVGCGIGARNRIVDWSVDRYIEVDETACEMPVAAGTSAVATCGNNVRAD